MICQTLIGFSDTAREFGVSRGELLDWVSRGICPRPLVVGDGVRFAGAEIGEWVADGCPPRDPPGWFAMHDIRIRLWPEFGIEFVDLSEEEEEELLADFTDEPENVIHFDHQSAPVATAAPPRPDTARRFRRR